MKDKIKGDYIARTHEQTLTIEELCYLLKTRGGYTGSVEDLIEHIHLFKREAAYQLCNGNGVSFGICSIHPQVGGMFNNPHEGVSEETHPVKFKFRVRHELRELAKYVKINIEGIADSGAYLEEFTDVDTDTVNQMVTPGGQFTLTGAKIKIDGPANETGVYFTSPGTPKVTIKVGKLAINEPHRLVGIVTELLPNRPWYVEVRTRFSGSGVPLKELRTITGEWPLTIAATQEAGSQEDSGTESQTDTKDDPVSVLNGDPV
jgi:hypothetical protein